MYREFVTKGRVCTDNCISRSMKRPNPKTNQPFKRGDTREDGYVFFNYTSKVRSDGYFMERWLSVEVSDKMKAKDKAHKKAKYKKKTDRHLPGFDQLSAQQQATVHMLKKLQAEIVQYNDLSEGDIVETLIGYELDAGPLLEEAIRHAGELTFDVREMFRKSLEC